MLRQLDRQALVSIYPSYLNAERERERDVSLSAPELQSLNDRETCGTIRIIGDTSSVRDMF